MHPAAAVQPAIPRRGLLVAVLVALAALAAGAPAAGAVTFPWTLASRAAGASETAAAAVCVLPDGGSIVTGNYQGTGIDFGDGVARTSGDAGASFSSFAAKLAADGRIVWIAVSGASGASFAKAAGCAATADGGALVTGSFVGVGVDLGDGVARTSAQGGASVSSYTQRLGAGGAVVWTRTSSAVLASDTDGTGISALPDGGAIVTGTFQGMDVDLGDGVPRTSAASGAAFSAFTQRLGANGAVAWTLVSSAAGASSTSGRGVRGLPDGGAIVTGDFRGVDVNLGDGAPRTSAQGGASTSAFTQRIAANGQVVWTVVSKAAGASFAQGNGVGALPDGSAVVTGVVQGAGVDLGDGVARTSIQSGASPSSFTQKLAADGRVLWVLVSGGTGAGEATGSSAESLPDGGAVITGGFSGAAIDLGDGVARSSAGGGGSYSSFTQRIAPDGRAVWTVASKASGASSTRGRGVAALPDGTVIVAGEFRGVNVDLGDGVARTSAEGGASISATVQKILDVPQAPAAPVAVAGDARAAVSITALGGPSVVSYRVTATPGGASCTVKPPATGCVVTGLVNRRSYTFAVRAANAAGEGPSSAASKAVVPAAALSAAIVRGGTRVVAGRPARISIRVRNTSGAPAAAVSACLTMPKGLIVTRRNGAVRTGRTYCFAIASLAPGAVATRSVRVRVRVARQVERRITGRASATDLSTVAALAKTVMLVPRPPRTAKP